MVVNIKCMSEVLNDATVNYTNPIHIQTLRRIHILVTLQSHCYKLIQQL